MNNELTLLQQIGLDDKEAMIYLAMLDAKALSISDIARKARVKRPTAYYVIEALIEMGLVVKIVKKNKNYYRAEHPSKISTLLDNKKQLFESILSKLDAKFRQSYKKPSVKFYEGKAAILNMYEKLFNTSKTIWSIINMDEFLKFINQDENFGRELCDLVRENGGYMYNMLQGTETAGKIRHNEAFKNISKSKILPKSFSSSVDVLVVGDFFAQVSFDSQVATLTEDQQLAKNQRQILKFLWKKV